MRPLEPCRGHRKIQEEQGSMAKCYLLQSEPSPMRGYVGYTLDKDTRIRQHNGALTGGARPTQKHRPWRYVAVVSGFPSSTEAKRFEYAWQQPRTPWVHMAPILRHRGLLTAGSAATYSTLRSLTKDWHKGADGIVWKLRVLTVMLGMELWRSMPLMVQFADASVQSLALAHACAPVPLGLLNSTAGALNLPAAAPVPKAVKQPLKRKREEEIIVVD